MVARSKKSAAASPVVDPTPGPGAAAAILPPPKVAIKPPAPQRMEKMMKNAEDFVAFSQGNFEAMMKSSQILMTGLQDLSKQMAATAQSTMDESMAAFKALSGVKSLKEAVDLQASLARTTMEKAMTGSGQFADQGFKLAEQAIAPITARLQLAAQKFTPAV